MILKGMVGEHPYISPSRYGAGVLRNEQGLEEKFLFGMSASIHAGGGEKNLEGACEIEVFHFGKEIDSCDMRHEVSLLDVGSGRAEGAVKTKNPEKKSSQENCQKKKKEGKRKKRRLLCVSLEKKQKESSQEKKEPRTSFVEKPAEHGSGFVDSGRVEPVFF